MATLSSLASITPAPSVSNKSKASLISYLCSSVKPRLYLDLCLSILNYVLFKYLNFFIINFRWKINLNIFWNETYNYNNIII